MKTKIDINKIIISDVTIDNPMIREIDDNDFIRNVDIKAIINYSIEFNYGGGVVEKPYFELYYLDIEYNVFEEILIFQSNRDIPDQWSENWYRKIDHLNLDDYEITFQIENLENGYSPTSIEISNNQITIY